MVLPEKRREIQLQFVEKQKQEMKKIIMWI